MKSVRNRSQGNQPGPERIEKELIPHKKGNTTHQVFPFLFDIHLLSCLAEKVHLD